MKKIKFNIWNLIHVSRLDRYIIGKFLSTYFFSIALIISVAVVFDFQSKMDKILNSTASVSQLIFDYYLNFIPYYSNLFSQLFVFISVIFFTVKLAENSEIIAMMSTGVSFKRLLRPYMIGAAIICALTYCLGAYVIPHGNEKRIKFESYYLDNDKAPLYTSNVQLQVDSGVIAYIGRYEDTYKTGYEFTLDKFENKKLVRHLQAMTIQYDTLSEKPGHWILSNYQTRDLKGMREIISSGMKCDTFLNMEPQDFLITKGQQETLTTPELKEYIKRQKSRGFANIKEFEVEYWKRGASCFAAFILTIIGVSLTAEKRKNGVGLAIAVGLALSVTYILFQTISSTFAINANLHPGIAMWIPNFIYIFIAYYFYKKAPR